MENYYPDLLERQQLIHDLIHQFCYKPSLKYSLSPQSSLILLKDERKLSRLRRFEGSPFPLLTNIELFSSSIGGFNEELESYGIQTRSKFGDPTKHPVSYGTHIFLITHDSPSSRGNRYLRRQYRRLELYRSANSIPKYWSLSFLLMRESWCFRISCLGSWYPNWYKELRFHELQRLWKGLHQILSLSETSTTIYNVWIESPKDKWRQLGVPNKAWRLYLHMLNMFITYIYSPHLPASIYDGFLYNRGVKSWWETVLWSPLLKTYSCILEVDLSSAFPNLNLSILSKALKSDGLIPPSIISLILTHLKSRQQSSPTFPTLETYIEHNENLAWRESDRSVPMGLGFSPILFVITLDWCLRELHLLQPGLTYKWYADDGSFYFNLGWLHRFKQQSSLSYWALFRLLLKKENPLLTYLNSLPLLQEAGIQFCSKKSGLVRIFSLWLKPYKSLGLTLYPSINLFTQLQHLILGWEIPLSLKASTRGRGANPKTGKSSTSPSHQELNFGLSPNHPRLQLAELISHYKPYFGLLMAKLYSGKLGSKPVSLLLKGTPKSPLGSLKLRKLNKILPKLERLNIYNCGSKFTRLLLNVMNNESNSLLEIAPGLKRNLKYTWKPISKDLLKERMNKNVIELNSKSSGLDYFKKYSEIQISLERFTQYKLEYEKQQSKLS